MCAQFDYLCDMWYFRSKHVIAIDIDPKKIEYAQHNAAIYGVDDRIDFLKGDSFLLTTKLKVLLLSYFVYWIRYYDFYDENCKIPLFPNLPTIG